jgi:hypothetical protein
MIRTIIGGLVGGIIMFVVGYIFWATPLGEIPYLHAGDPESAAVQLSMNENLTRTGTGTYIIPNYLTASGAAGYSQGPIATVHFNTQGYSRDDMSMILPGFISAVVAGLLMAFALAGVAGGGRRFSSVARLVVLFSLGITVWTILAQPIFDHFGWRYWVYSFIAGNTGLILAGLVIARWFMPVVHTAVAAAPDEVPAETPAEPIEG